MGYTERPQIDFQILARTRGLTRLTTAQHKALAARCAVSRVRAREVLELRAGALIVIKGALRSLSFGKGEVRTVIAILGPGDMAFHCRSAGRGLRIWREALTDSVVAEISREDFADIVLGISWKKLAPAMDALAGREWTIIHRYTSLFGQPLKSRMIETLRDLGRRFGVRDSRGLLLSIAVTTHDFAGLVGCSKRQALDILEQLSNRGLICRDGRRLILNESGLAAMAAEIVAGRRQETPATSCAAAHISCAHDNAANGDAAVALERRPAGTNGWRQPS